MNLDGFDEIDNYRKYFMDVNFWQPYVAVIMEKVGLSCQRVLSGVAGSYPTFIVDDHYVVKFFGKLFNGGFSYLAELNANLLLNNRQGIPAPGLVTQGKLNEDGQGWPWPFLVFEYLNGISIGQAWPYLSLCSKDEIARELGRIVRCLHSIPLSSNGYFQPKWETYRQFLEQQKSNCVANFQNNVEIPSHLLQQLESFLLPLDVLVNIEQAPHLIHADLTRDHLLGRIKDGNWVTLGIIDFGDAIVGNLFYELVALHLDLFQCDKCLLKIFLDQYGVDKDLQEDFAIRAMNVTLLHQFGAGILTDLFRRYPKLQQANTFVDLANELWGVEN